jgi:hypothetical protein
MCWAAPRSARCPGTSHRLSLPRVVLEPFAPCGQVGPALGMSGLVLDESEKALREEAEGLGVVIRGFGLGRVKRRPLDPHLTVDRGDCWHNERVEGCSLPIGVPGEQNAGCVRSTIDGHYRTVTRG